LLVRIAPEVKNYAWGSKNLIQDHFGIGREGDQIAELWFGTQLGSESKALTSGENLSELIGSRLSFLVKLLAAESPLSIQVHPKASQAASGFEAEQKLGVDLLDPARNYKDNSHKPELLIALTPFSALCGFRPRAEILAIFEAFSESESRFGELVAQVKASETLEGVFVQLLKDQDLAARFKTSMGAQVFAGSDQSLALNARNLAMDLLARYPNDTGALVALLLNRIELIPGQAIFLPAGNIHAYLEGLAIEVMAASENVIRAGLTSKHIDQEELVKITDFTELTNPVVMPKKLAEGLVQYPVAASEFQVYKADVTGANLLADIELPAEALIVCVSGEVAVSTSLEERQVLKRAEVVYLSEAKKFSLSGGGTAFVVLGS
jgi:mannose-6-phosphate isomerase